MYLLIHSDLALKRLSVLFKFLFQIIYPNTVYLFFISNNEDPSFINSILLFTERQEGKRQAAEA